MTDLHMYRLYLCSGPNCSARNSRSLRSALDTALWDANLLDQVEVILGGCQDHCDYGPNLLIHPGAYRYVELNAERIQAIVTQHLVAGEPIADWLATPAMRRSTNFR